MRTAILGAIVTVVAVVLVGITDHGGPRLTDGPGERAPAEHRRVRLGVGQPGRGGAVYRELRPFLSTLEAELGERLGSAVVLELRLLRDSDESVRALLAGEVDLARLEPIDLVLAGGVDGRIPLLAMERLAGRPVPRGLIVVRADGPLWRAPDLIGRRLGLGRRGSTIADSFGPARLLADGLYEQDFAALKRLDGDHLVLTALLGNEIDAGLVDEDSLDTFELREHLRIIDRFTSVPHPWVGRPELPLGTRRAFRAALFSIRDPAALSVLGLAGFKPVRREDYRAVETAMVQARRFRGR